MLVQRRKYYEQSNLDELTNLAIAAGYSVVGCLEQMRRPDATFQIGRGKAEELAEMVKKLSAEKVIFENELQPRQTYNLANITNVEIIDRFQLILEIFGQRASTQEAQLQIQLARLHRQLPRAKESVRLARLGERPGFRGLGQYEVDIYFDDIRRQIAGKKNELIKVQDHRRLHRNRRSAAGFPIISLAGYTDAGKTTLFNALTGETKLVESTLFTTLTTTTRAIKLEGGRALLTDTVGFIDRLPVALVEAFHSTLEETILADLIILMVDLHESVEEIRRKLTCSQDTITEIGAGGVPTITALNKIDLLEENEITSRVMAIQDLTVDPILISAQQHINTDQLKQHLGRVLDTLYLLTLQLPLNDESLSYLSELHEKVTIVQTEYRDRTIAIKLKCYSHYLEEIENAISEHKGQVVTCDPLRPH
ncbi:MAG: GTPase HflX [Candidatus Bathyarchaeota archaeon]|nr:GTPase HflX [Candidatus Bathyarchaeota archaeon]